MDCEHFRKLVRDELNGKLHWPRSRGYKEHRAGCEVCNRYALREEVLWESESVGGKPNAARSPVVRIAEAVIEQALRDHADAVRLSTSPEGVRTDYRVGEDWTNAMSLPGYVEIPLIARFKLMAELGVHEDSAPQEGRIRVCIDDKNYVLDLTTAPGEHGEDLEMRIRAA